MFLFFQNGETVFTYITDVHGPIHDLHMESLATLILKMWKSMRCPKHIRAKQSMSAWKS